MIVRSGSYVGNGTSKTISLSDIGGTPDFVCVFNGDNGVYGCFVTSATDANKTYYFANDTSNFSGGITIASLQFSLDSSITVNGSGKTHYWIAVRDDGASNFKVGSYVGNGSAGHGITGIGFQPDAVIIKSNTTVTNQSIAVESDSLNAGKSADFGSIATNNSTRITSLDADGFTVGTGNGTNDNGTTYFYVAIKNTASKFKVLSYTGNGSSGHAITGVGFQPDLTWTLDYTTQRFAIARQRDSSGVDQSFSMANQGYETSGITSLDSDGFTLGTSARTNTNAEAYQTWNFLAPLPTGSPSASVSPSLSPSASLSPSRSLSPSASQSPSASASRSLSPSSSASSSVSASSSASASKSASASASRSLSPSASQSPSASGSASGSSSASKSQSPSASPSTGFADYSRGNYAALPTDDAELETLYSGSDVTDVATDNGVRVSQSAITEYMIHQYKNFVGANTNCVLTWNGQTDLSPASSTVNMQIYNRNSTTWETIASNNTASANTDFTIAFTVNDVTNYIDGDKVISSRIYQLAL